MGRVVVRRVVEGLGAIGGQQCSPLVVLLRFYLGVPDLSAALVLARVVGFEEGVPRAIRVIAFAYGTVHVLPQRRTGVADRDEGDDRGCQHFGGAHTGCFLVNIWISRTCRFYLEIAKVHLLHVTGHNTSTADSAGLQPSRSSTRTHPNHFSPGPSRHLPRTAVLWSVTVYRAGRC